MWLLYIALEPYARRRWPLMLVSWKRLISGDVHDPLVGRDLLLGVACGIGMFLVFLASVILPVLLGRPPMTPGLVLDGSGAELVPPGGVPRVRERVQRGPLRHGVPVRPDAAADAGPQAWLAAAIWCVMVSAPLPGEDPVVGWLGGICRSLLMLAMLVRGGLLALVTALYVLFALAEVPLTLNLSRVVHVPEPARGVRGGRARGVRLLHVARRQADPGAAALIED